MTRAFASPRRGGFSMLGVLMGVAIISFLLMPLFLHFQSARTGARRNAHSLTAATLATTQIEKLRRLTYRRLESILLTQGTVESVEREEIAWPNVIAGPFEEPVERPDIIEKAVAREGQITYHRLTFLSYFPRPNPNPNSPEFDRDRRRMRVRVQVRWDEPLGPKRFTPRRFEVSTMIHDEGYNPKPSLRQLVEP